MNPVTGVGCQASAGGIVQLAFIPSPGGIVVVGACIHNEPGRVQVWNMGSDPFHTQAARVRLPSATLGLPAGSSYRVKDLLSGDIYRWQDDWNFVRLNPQELPVHVFEVVSDTNPQHHG